MILGRPDLSILDSEFERGEKFYEPQYSFTRISAPAGTFSEPPEMNGAPVEIKFRESESQIKQEQSMLQDALRKQAFM